MVALTLVIKTFPAVRRILKQFKRHLQGRPGFLVREAANSIRDKEFHCLGGAAFVQLAPKVRQDQLLRFIVAYQTISDYLDNLCDRLGITDQQVFRELHMAMEDAVDPSSFRGDYYRSLTEQEDFGYLSMLVDECRQALTTMAVFSRVKARIGTLTRLYIDLQAYKHQEHSRGKADLSQLHQRYHHLAPQLYWWEFAAVCGSTLGIFSLLASEEEPRQVFDAYVPWICGLHILLDYFIDQEEDRVYGDLNLVACYPDEALAEARIAWFVIQAQRAAGSLPEFRFHKQIVDGLLAMYLSDPKTQGELAGGARRILAAARTPARGLTVVARCLRRAKVL